MSESANSVAERPDAWPALRRDAARHAATRRQGVAEHRPRVAVLACSDARVPPSVVFDRPAGDLFVVRIAGNTAAPSAVASLEYAVTRLGVETLVVLGHTDCGAVAAALDGACGGSLAPVVAPLCELAERTGCDDACDLARLNVAATVEAIAAASPAIAAAIAGGRLAVHGAVYDLATGELLDVAAGPVAPFTITSAATTTTAASTVPLSTVPPFTVTHHEETP